MPAELAGAGIGLFPNVAITNHNVFLRGQAFEADRSTRMELVRTDTYFGTESVFKAIGKTGRSVDHDRTGIDFGEKASGVDQVFRHYRISVF